MKTKLLSLVLLIGFAVCVHSTESYGQQTTRYSTTTIIMNYPNPSVTRGIAAGPTTPFAPSGVTTPMNRGSGSVWKKAGNDIQLMNWSFIVKVQSLPPHLYKAFSEAANEMRKNPARSAMLRRLIYELPSRMEGTTYVPPSPNEIFGALRRVYYSTDAQVANFWAVRQDRTLPNLN